MSNTDQPVYGGLSDLSVGPSSSNSSDISGGQSRGGGGALIECALNELNPYPLDSNHYFLNRNGERLDAIDTAYEGTKVIFQCLDTKSKTAERECLGDGAWSAQSHAIRCDPKRYWIAVIAAATSAFIIVVLLIYFTCSAYNKRKRRKYVARKERIREQDDVMLRNENFVRLNFRPMQLQTISQEMDPNNSNHGMHATGDDVTIAPSAPQEELPPPNHVSNNRH
jgi:hypothetical protein